MSGVPKFMKVISNSPLSHARRKNVGIQSVILHGEASGKSSISHIGFLFASPLLLVGHRGTAEIS